MTTPTSGPAVEHLTRRLAECPAEFLLDPRTAVMPGGQVDVAAVVNDLLVALGGEGLPVDEAERYAAAAAGERNHLRLTLVAAWLCQDPWLCQAGRFAPAVQRWLGQGLRPLAALMAADLFVSDPDRREELARAMLEALALVPVGEVPAAAADRLRALSSVERARILQDTRAQQQRARKLREQMAEERARQAAARYSSE